MRIAILGSRGIPNYYGGFEQFAEYLSQGLVNIGHDVFVYNTHTHPYKGYAYNKVNLIHKYDPEHLVGSASQLIYDLLCILDARKKDFDIILKLGYGTNFIWNWLIPKNAVIICNLDGIEWSRSKYRKLVQWFLKMGEVFTVRNTDYLITDSICIHQYLEQNYNATSYHVPYGAVVFENPDPSILKNYQLEINNYDMLVARLVPENNSEMILEGVLQSHSTREFLVIGNDKTGYGKYLKKKYADPRIRFLGGIYCQESLNNFRYFSNLYFHGHSAGGTNPSLLEAMASNSHICAHDNIFNRAILGNESSYFSSAENVIHCLENPKADEEIKKRCELNLEKIKRDYSWDKIVLQYDHIFRSIINYKIELATL
jgi:glycosyltransferase involved in cell wall biosynthesis